MSEFRQGGSSVPRAVARLRYSFRADECIGLDCWAPGAYQHRGATPSGSRNTGAPDSLCCLNRAYHGCPSEGDPQRVYNLDLAKSRKAAGWKKA